MEATTTTPWKYSYWLDNDKLALLKEQMQAAGTTMTVAQQNPCEAIRGEIGYAEPHVWPAICKHDATPWYDESKFAGKNLVVSSFPLDGEYEAYLETTIEPVGFSAPVMPTEDEQSRLVEDPAFLSKKPQEWGKFPKEMGDAIVKGLGQMDDTTPETFEELLKIWTAVHANFVNPQYRAGTDFNRAPYSIAKSVHISSCCVEFFNLFDSPDKALLVRPCIGGVIVKVFKQDQYYLVKNVRNG